MREKHCQLEEFINEYYKAISCIIYLCVYVLLLPINLNKY